MVASLNCLPPDRLLIAVMAERVYIGSILCFFAVELWRTAETIQKWLGDFDLQQLILTRVVKICDDHIHVQPHLTHPKSRKKPQACKIPKSKVESIQWELRIDGIRAALTRTERDSYPHDMFNPTVRGKPIPASPYRWGEADIRRQIKWVYHSQFRSAPRAYWSGEDSVVSQIAAIVKCDSRTVKRVLERIEEHGFAYDVGQREPQDRDCMLSDSECATALKLMRDGFSLPQATGAINLLRNAEGVDIVAPSTLRNAIDTRFNARALVCRPIPQTGRENWVRTRLMECELVDTKRSNGEWLPEGTLFSDESHTRCRVGGVSDHDWVGTVDPNDHTEPMSIAAGGVPGPRMTYLNPKYKKEVRHLFGVMKKLVYGVWQGFKTRPIDYTGYWIVGPKKFMQCVQATIVAVRNSPAWIKGIGRWNYGTPEDRTDTVNPFLVKYGENKWLRRAVRAAKKCFKKMCVTELMDQLIEEGNRAFKGTIFQNTWMIWHDALPAWFCTDAQVWCC